MQCAKTLVSLFQSDRHSNAIPDAVAAPSRTDAALHRTQRLGVRMPTLYTRSDKLSPDIWQVIHLRAKQINPLPSRDFAVQVVLLYDLRDHNQLIWGEFAASYTWNH